MSAALRLVSRRKLSLFTAAFAVAAAAFWGTMLTSPPQTEAATTSSISTASTTSDCMITPIGDIASCSARN